LNVPSAHYSGGTLAVNGPFIVADSMRATVASTALAINSAVTIPIGATWSMRSTGGIVGTGALVNNGTFVKSNSSSTIPIGVPFDNAGTLTSSLGTLNFTRQFSHQGGATIRGNAAISVVPDSVLLWDGALAPSGTAATGQLTINGALVQGVSAPIDLEIGGVTVGSQYDRLVLSSNAILGGVLNVTLINGFTPTIGAFFDIVTSSAGGLSLSSFSAVNLPADFTLSFPTANTARVTYNGPP
jgi:hypothetical protein